jgi:branched-chain amino acid transport system ATP-binding protein
MTSATTARDTAVLELHEVTMRFGGLVAVDGVSLALGAGERCAVIGPNGAGKTTLFRTVAGEHFPTSGRIELFSKDVTRMTSNRRAHRGIGRTYQVTDVFLDLSVQDNVTIAAQALTRARFRMWRPVRLTGTTGERVEHALEQVELADRRHRLARELSHGEQRQLELALALAGEPRVLLLDEPAAGLSASERGLMRRLIENLPDALTVVLIEHDMSLALDLVERVLVMDNGTPIAHGTPDEIRGNEQVQAVYLKSD